MREWEVNCYEAKEDGTLEIHVESGDDYENIVVSASDVARLMYAAIDALRHKGSRR